MRLFLCGLGNLRRQIAVICLLGVSCVVAVAASAAARPTLFRLTLVGTTRQEWSYTAPPVDVGGCTTTETTEGIRTAAFRSKEPVLVRLLNGRMFPAEVRAIAGKVTLGGANTTDTVCGTQGTTKIADCAPTTRSFAQASVRVGSPRRGFVSVDQVGNVRLARSDCPLEPVDVRRRPLGPAAGSLRLPKEALMEQRVTRITLHVSRTRRKAYASPEKGRLTERVQWTLRFDRVGS